MSVNMTNITGVECGGDSGADPRWIAAIGFSCVASCGAATGLVMQKLAHNNQQALPEEEKAWESNGFIASPLWVCGMVVLVFVPLPFDLVALTLGALSCVHERRLRHPLTPLRSLSDCLPYPSGPQSLIMPLAGVTVVMVQILAPWILGEMVTMLDWCATGLIFVGCAGCATFGSHCN